MEEILTPLKEMIKSKEFDFPEKPVLIDIDNSTLALLDRESDTDLIFFLEFSETLNIYLIDINIIYHNMLKLLEKIKSGELMDIESFKNHPLLRTMEKRICPLLNHIKYSNLSQLINAYHEIKLELSSEMDT